MRRCSIRDTERLLLAKAVVSLLATVGKTTRRFESFPSPPHLDEVGLWVEVL